MTNKHEALFGLVVVGSNGLAGVVRMQVHTVAQGIPRAGHLF